MPRLFPLVLACAALAFAGPGRAQVAGAGATFPSRVYASWTAQYQRQTGVQVTYKGTGSGDGLQQITERRVDFAGSDSPLSPAELARRKLVQVPTVVGGIVPVVHLPGIGDAQLQLDGPTLAAIEMGAVAQWNDERIAALNRGLTLPALPIRRIVRKDKSGTSEGFARYLAAASASFREQVGVSQLPPWPGATLAAEGNDGVARTLKLTPGAIAYVSYDRVLQDGLVAVRLKNAAGRFVAPGEAGFRAAIVDSDMARSGDDLASLIDRGGPDTWPISSATFVLLDAQPASAERASRALRYVYWCFMHGDELTRGTGFAPLPVSVQSRLAPRLATVRAQDGKPLDYVSY